MLFILSTKEDGIGCSQMQAGHVAAEVTSQGTDYKLSTILAPEWHAQRLQLHSEAENDELGYYLEYIHPMEG